ncbi:Peptidoglycan binding-like [Syntrophomonas zehnderi OL-4]|uniref:Peptidoglycan binding-like n=1 Tax=Syntrophomonas zehnderi OL-4 TaxID=690567 RepID=A0A0E3W3Y4_9FIRM|nr:peptidoglycan-binding domain-containing protein [Syntrophomonas zehnderi]CFY12410.1 Peptidoglycan binding-like [Syntrophomonas zehnderi OL-4]
MKKEYVWFLILVLAAAVLTGSTLGIVTNFSHIVQYHKPSIKEQNPEVQSLENQINEKPAQDLSPLHDEPMNVASPGGIAVVTPDETIVLSVSESEKAAITAMLNSVQPSHSPDFDTNLKHFQEKNYLPATGIVDLQTLQTLINQATIQRAAQHLHN